MEGSETDRAEADRNAESLFSDLKLFIAERLALSAADISIVSLYIIATYCVRVFPAFPLIAFIGLFGSGKSTSLGLVHALSHRPIMLGALITRATLYRELRTWRTAIIDEFSSWPRGLKHVVSLLLRDRWRYSAVVTTARSRHKFHGPTSIALDARDDNSALYSRMISIWMDGWPRRNIPTDPSAWRSNATPLRRRISTFVQSNRTQVYQVFTQWELLPGVPGRVLEVWQPLAAIASVLEQSGQASGLLALVRSRVEEDARQFSRLRDELDTHIPLDLLREFIASTPPIEGHYFRADKITDFLKNKSDRFTSLSPSVLGRALRAQGLLRDSKRIRAAERVDPASPRETWPQFTAYRFEERRLRDQS